MTSEEGEVVPRVENSTSERRRAQLAQWREKFVQNLETAGLQMEKVLWMRFRSIKLLINYSLVFYVF